jgi:hypothetical protein
MAPKGRSSLLADAIPAWLINERKQDGLQEANPGNRNIDKRAWFMGELGL